MALNGFKAAFFREQNANKNCESLMHGHAGGSCKMAALFCLLLLEALKMLHD